MTTVRSALALCLAALSLAACTEDPLFPERSIQVTGSDMPPLAGDAVYELWLSYPGEIAREKRDRIDHNLPQYFSVGRFTVDASGALRSASGGAPAFAIPVGYNPALIAEAIVSVEPRQDDDTIPDAVMLSGRFLGTATRGHAILEPSGSRAFDSTALSLRGGSFVLEAPTSSDPADALSGIWFVLHQRNQTTGDSLTPGLRLPAQPLNHDNDTWTYEAWLTERTAGGTTYSSLGRFRSPASADANGAGPGAGANPSGAYPYPGEDFVVPSRPLADTTYGVIVSLQPEDIPLAAPLVRLLERPMMPVSVNTREEIFMSPTQRLPIIEVTIDR